MYVVLRNYIQYEATQSCDYVANYLYIYCLPVNCYSSLVCLLIPLLVVLAIAMNTSE